MFTPALSQLPVMFRSIDMYKGFGPLVQLLGGFSVDFHSCPFKRHLLGGIRPPLSHRTSGGGPGARRSSNPSDPTAGFHRTGRRLLRDRLDQQRKRIFGAGPGGLGDRGPRPNGPAVWGGICLEGGMSGEDELLC